MKKETKDKKSTKTSWVGKTATMAAVVAALGISLGVNVQKVYAYKDGEDGVNRVVQDKNKHEAGSQQGKIESQQSKIKSSVHQDNSDKRYYQGKIESQQSKIKSQ
jgi:uncharacterized protein HemX